MFSDHITPKEFKTQRSPVILDSCLKNSRSEKPHEYRDAVVFKKLRLKSQCVQITSALKQERSQKAPFSWRITVNGAPNRRFQIPPV